MGSSVRFDFPEGPKPAGPARRSSEPPVTCIVSDAYLGVSGVCGMEAAEDRECPEPVCADHLCQCQLPNGRRCTRTPLRLVRGLVFDAAGWLPNTIESANCQRHERYNCTEIIDGTVRCSGTRIQGQDYCPAHAAALCRWDKGCAVEVDGESDYCKRHRCGLGLGLPRGYRCLDPRGESSFYCQAHRCTWKMDEHWRCPNLASSGLAGVCLRHMCFEVDCGHGARDGADRCFEHVCAFEPEGWPRGVPACYHKPLLGQPFCAFHDRV